MPRPAAALAAFVLCLGLSVPAARAQSAGTFDAQWYRAGAVAKIRVVADGVYRVTGAELAAAGFPVGSVPAARLELVESGRAVPLLRLGGTGATLSPTDTLVFVGQRNRGTAESWAYDRADSQSSPFYSLYSDTTTYWLRDTGAAPGLRYAAFDAPTGAAVVSAVRDTVHLETDTFTFQGSSSESGHPWYTRGEGLYMTFFQSSTNNVLSETYTLAMPERTGADSVTVEVRATGGSASGHRLRLFAVGSSRVIPLDDRTWSGYGFQTLRGRVAASEITPGAPLTLRIDASNEMLGAPNYVFVDYVEAAFTRALGGGGGRASDRFRAPSGDVSLRLGGYRAGTPVVALAPGIARAAVLPGATSDRALDARLAASADVWTAEASALRTPLSIRAATLPSALATPTDGADYVIVTRAALRASADRHADYQRAVHGRRVVVVEQEQVFDEFDYGRPTPVALRRFTRALRAWPRAPQYLVLWGDALASARSRPLTPWEVLSYGDTPSDAWFAMQTASDADFTESIALGRIPARTDADGAVFTAKLQRYEATAPAPWQRRSVHVSGGYSDGERALLASYQRGWIGTERTLPTRLDTTLLLKTSDLVVDAVYRDRLAAEFRQGMLWFTYFSHSSPQVWEVIAPPAEEMDNANVLPVVLSLGCRTGAFTLGNASLATRSLSEALVIGSPSGGIAHWGTSELSTISSSAAMATEVHRLAFTDTARVLGPIFREAKRRFATRTPVASSDAIRNLMQYALIGDPSTTMALARGPEYRVEGRDIAVEVPPAGTSARTAALTLRLHNDGLLSPDSVDVRITHRLPSGVATVVSRRVRFAEDSAFVAVTLSLPEGAVGEHRVSAVVDVNQRASERNEADNAAERTFFLYASGVALASPGPNGITGIAPVLRVTPLSVGRAPVAFVAQIDTSRTFASPARREFRATSSLVAEWPQTGLTPGQTYHWRARVDEAAQADVWTSGSFTVRPDLTDGFFAQGADLAALATGTLVREGGAWRFATEERAVQVSAERGGGEFKGQITYVTDTYLPVTLGWGVVVIDGQTGRVRHAESFPTYAMDPSLETRFKTNPAQARRRLDSLASTLKPRDVVVARSRFLGNLSGPALQSSERESMRRLGSTAIDTLTYGHMWLMVHRVGVPGEHVEQVAGPTETSNEITYRTSILVPSDRGTLTTAPIGPAMRWERGLVSVDGVGAAGGGGSVSGTASVEVLAPDGSVLRAASPANAPLDLSSINARVHPYLRLRVTVGDTTRIAAPQPRSAYALFDRVPELTLDGAALTLSRDTLMEAEPLRVTVPVAHLGQSGTTDAIVRYVVVDAANRERLAATDTLRAIAPGARRTSTATIATTGLAGRNRLRVSVEQPGLDEPLLSNNTTQTTFTVSPDRERPRFAVRLDGEAYRSDPSPVANLQDPRYPIVSARPTVEIVVTDGATFRPIADTSFARLTLDGKPIRFSRPDVRFTPASTTRPEASLVFTPDLSGDDATHTIQLRVFDASGNEAEGSPYQVHFRVTSTTAVEEVLPYPNPMRDRTTFAFRLRGADAASIEELRLRIFTVAGTLVREFDLVDDPSALASGAIRIGWNRLRWDGTDADGDALAPGVYLYRVQARAAGERLSVENGSRVERLVIVR